MKEKKVGWIHPIDESDQWDGFNDSGIEHFRGNPIPSLAREIVQNSLDAKFKSPVVVEFNRIEVPLEEVPDIDELRENFKICAEVAIKESGKADAFFKEANSLLERTKIPLLQIVDRNTEGMRGPCENGTPYYAFMKAAGQSIKDATSTGSYGIGKNAPFAVSSLRTIFVSTVYKEASGELTRLTQGKSILMSHDYNGERRRGQGYWGVKARCKPVENLEGDLPLWLKPDLAQDDESNCGTVLAVLGFQEDENWREILAAAIAENFFGAIWEERLEVKINGEIDVNSSNVSSFLQGKYVEAVRGEKGEPDRIENCSLYLKALSNSTEVVQEAHENRELGLCSLKILLGEGLPKKVCALRNGMFITDQMDGLKKFSEFKEFVAVIECKSKKGNELLRNMEPPKHNDFEPQRLSTQQEIRRGKRALRDLTGWVREMLRRHAKDPVSDVTSVDELSEYFGDDQSEDGKKPGEEKNPEGNIVITAKPLPRKNASRFSRRSGGYEESSQEGAVSGGKGSSRDESGNKGANEEGNGSAARAIRLINVRAIPVDVFSRIISFTPTVSGSVQVSLEEAGADINYPLQINSASLGEVAGKKLMVEVEAGKRCSVTVEFSEPYAGAVRVIAHEI